MKLWPFGRTAGWCFRQLTGEMSRPEHSGPPELFYNETEVVSDCGSPVTLVWCVDLEKKIGGRGPRSCIGSHVEATRKQRSTSSRMVEVQWQLSERALELLALPEDSSCYLMDVGCGSGLSGETLSENGHIWAGLDISSAMLDVAVERQAGGDLFLADMGNGLPFRAGTFDGAISISAIQWLCNADTKWHNPVRRLYRLFSTLYACLRQGARAVFQLYPENEAQLELITQQAMKAGFSGGLVVDYPNSSKAKKLFLCLFAGGSAQQLPSGLADEDAVARNQAQFSREERRNKLQRLRGQVPKKSREWIREKKERRRRRGFEVRPDSKFTGRRRPTAF